MAVPTVIPAEDGSWVLVEENAPSCLLSGVSGVSLSSLSPMLLVLGAAVVGAGIGMLRRRSSEGEE